MQYLAGKEVDFSGCETDLSGFTEFERDVLECTRRIPYGETLTYSEVAEAIGRPGASRAVGAALGKNPYPIIIPCHRVVGKNSLGGYSGGGTAVKRKLLEIEKEASHAKNKEGCP